MGLASIRLRLSRTVSAVSVTALAILLASSALVLPARAAPLALKLGVYENQPLTHYDAQGQPQGLYIDIVNEIARREDWKVEYERVDFDEGMKLTEAGQLDGLLVVARTAERSKRYVFPSSTVFTNWGVLVVKDGSPIKSLSDIAGRKIAVIPQDVYYAGSGGLAELAGGLGLTAEYVEYDDYDAAIDAVVAGQADAAVTNRLAPLFHPAANKVRLAAVFRPSELSVALPRDSARSATVAAAIDAHLAEMQDNPGSVYYQALRQHVYRESEPSVDELPGWLIPSALGLFTVITLLGGLSILLRVEVGRRTRDLAEAVGRLEAQKEANPDAMFVLDKDLRFREYKPAAAFRSYVPPADFMGKTPSEVLPPETSALLMPALERALQGEAGVVEEYSLPDRDDPKAVCWYELRAVRSGPGELLALVRDVTDRHRLMDALRDQEGELRRLVDERTRELEATTEELRRASTAKSRFLAHMSHELRTPLNSVIGFSGLLLSDAAGPLNEEQSKQLGMIQSSGKHLLALVEEILDISRIEAEREIPEPAEFDLSGLVQEAAAVVECQTREKGLDLRTRVCRGLSVISDERMVKQILLNLCSNAVAYTDAGSVTIACADDGDTAVISVSDTGPGIRLEDRARLFEPFTRLDHDRARSGAGLGLAISARLAGLIGGTIEVASSEGRGSTFSLRLPKSWRLDPPQAE